MQHNVGIVRDEGEMLIGAGSSESVLGARQPRRRHRQSRFQSGLAHGTRPARICSPFRKRSRALRSSGRKAAARNFAKIIRRKTNASAKVNTIIRKADGRHDGSSAGAVAGDAGLFEADHRGDEVSGQKQATFRIWRGNAQGGEFRDYTTERFRGNGRARCGQSHSGDAGERPRLPMELQGRQMRLVFGRNQRHAEVDVHDATERSAARQTR